MSRTSPTGQKDRSKRPVVIVALVILVPAAIYFIFSAANSMQSKFDTAREKERLEKDSDGGEVGHIASLYGVLDATDPARYEKKPDKSDARRGKSFPSASMKPPAEVPSTVELPVLPAIWTLDLDTAKIPVGKANGMISGTNFVVESARLEKTPTANVLVLRQGTNFYADREILVYLRLKPGEKIEGHTWTVSPEMQAGVPQIAKRWKTNPKFAPQQKFFPNGYTMKLELGQMNSDVLPGKIYLALPDSEKSVVAGQFNAAISLASAAPASLQSRRPGSAGYRGEE